MRRLWYVCPVVLAVALAGCDSTAKPTPSAAPGPPSATRSPSPGGTRSPTAAPTIGPTLPVGPGDWSTFGHDNQRTGVAPGFPAITDPHIAWHAALDGAVYGQPLAIGDLVFAATENDTVYALRADTGAVVWQQHVGTPVRRSALPCGNIDPLGITGTMAYDPATGSVFAVAESTGGTHTLYGFDARSGAVTQRHAAEPPFGDRIAHQQRTALTVLDGRVYIGYGGLAGDCAHYIGSVVGVPTRGAGANVGYAIPTTREGGIWAPGGGVVARVGGADRLLWAAGNGESTQVCPVPTTPPCGYDGSDSVVSLDPQLKLRDRFSPDTWAQDNAQDLDLGSMSPALVGGYVVTTGKRGTSYVLAIDHFGGVGGDVFHADTCRAFGAAAVAGQTIYLPCSEGTRAYTVGADGTLTPLWQAGVPAGGSPMVGGGAIWVTDYSSGVLYRLDPATGRTLSQVNMGSLPHFAAPTLAGGQVLLGTAAGVSAVR